MRQRFHHGRWLLEGWALLMLAVGASAQTPTTSPGDYMIDLSKRHQTIDHFAASDCWSMQMIGGWSLENREKVADLLFTTDKGIGLSMWRFNIGGGINNYSIRDRWRTAETFEVDEGKYDWTRQANERWFLAAAKARGVGKFLAFVNSPPGRMTRSHLTNAAIHGGGEIDGTTNLKDGFERQFARYLADILAHFRDNPDDAQRINFDWISPVNEATLDWVRGQEGNRAANDDIKRIVLALHAELQRQNLGARILVPESNNIHGMVDVARAPTEAHGATYGDYINAFCADPELSPLLSQTLCYHDYGSDGDDQLISQRRQLRERIDKYPGWQLWQSEYCVLNAGRDLSMTTALKVARLIHCDLTVAGASAWSWWLAISPYDYKDGLLYTDWKNPGDDESVIPSKLLWAVGNFSRFIRPGFVRVDVAGPNDDIKGLMCSAYFDAPSGRVVIVCINSSDAPITMRLSLVSNGVNMPVTPLVPHVTSDENDLRPQTAVEQDKPYEVPARSVVTLVGTLLL